MINKYGYTRSDIEKSAVLVYSAVKERYPSEFNLFQSILVIFPGGFNDLETALGEIMLELGLTEPFFP